MTGIEQTNIEKTTTWWTENKINTYENLLKWKEIGKAQTEDERKQADNLIVEIQWNKGVETKKEGETKNTKIETWRTKQWEKFVQNNPEKKDRLPAGENIPKSLNESQKGNFLWQTFQWISKRILWRDNV